ncbi:hypothetical protein J1605_009107 [Eschrichtius robustus]|uniref:Uncharacterized protein n=1 Tax=Eschrichtius robustus TaxID=9764 RepID=A0AB34GW57_ESCRO|nr:hypothetical protein J1605_009107 [Eschrichtius robustus]
MATSLHEGPTNQLDLLIRAVQGVRCPLRSPGRPGERGVVNEVMEATNQEVITLESNLPGIRRCRFRVGLWSSGGGCRAERWQRLPGSRAAVKGRCCPRSGAAGFSGGRSPPPPRSPFRLGPQVLDFRADEAAPGHVR